MKLAPETTLRDARTALQAQLRKGARCPVCRQNARVYRRNLDSASARALILLVKLHAASRAWVHVRGIVKQLGSAGGDLAKLVHWGLVEAKPNPDDPAKRDSGYWKPTPLGIQFAMARATVPKYAELYDGKLLRLDDSQRIDIYAALGKRFNYAELMGTVAKSAPYLSPDNDDDGVPPM